jgi:methyl-accepting chemotaxis protein
MLGFGKNHRVVAEAEAAAAPLAPGSDLEAAVPPPHDELLRRWMSLAQMQQRVIVALAGEVARTSSFVETEADALSSRFRRLAINAQQQSARVDSLTGLSNSIEVDGNNVSIEFVTELLENTLSDVVSKILMLSKDSMSMVYALDQLSANVQQAEKCMAQLNAINATTNMLALNARIEAERAGVGGAAFRVVANEVRELSKATQTLSADMRQELQSITDGIASGHVTLKRVATVDMSENVLAKDKLDVLMVALRRRGETLGGIVADAVQAAEAISTDVDGMVTGIQFQDRTKQRLEHVIDTLEIVGQAIDKIEHETTAALPELMASSVPDTAWVKQLLDRYTMSEMRERFVLALLDGKSEDAPDDVSATTAPTSSGSIELF